MKTLIMDSTADILILGGENEGTTEFFCGDPGARRHTGAILVAIDTILNKLNMTPKDLEYICVVTGPGSFTGIRIGVATANAMAYATGAKIVSVTSLEPLLYGQKEGLALLDCGHNNYYALARDKKGDRYLAIKGEEKESFGLPVFYHDGTYVRKLMDTVKDKINRCEAENFAKPFYIKKSSAEAMF
jgi:tRNA threonylcarbamoyl adenosine modification protein YeaZ